MFLLFFILLAFSICEAIVCFALAFYLFAASGKPGEVNASEPLPQAMKAYSIDSTALIIPGLFFIVVGILLIVRAILLLLALTIKKPFALASETSDMLLAHYGGKVRISKTEPEGKRISPWDSKMARGHFDEMGRYVAPDEAEMEEGMEDEMSSPGEEGEEGGSSGDEDADLEMAEDAEAEGGENTAGEGGGQPAQVQAVLGVPSLKPTGRRPARAVKSICPPEARAAKKSAKGVRSISVFPSIHGPPADLGLAADGKTRHSKPASLVVPSVQGPPPKLGLNVPKSPREKSKVQSLVLPSVQGPQPKNTGLSQGQQGKKDLKTGKLSKDPVRRPAQFAALDMTDNQMIPTEKLTVTTDNERITITTMNKDTGGGTGGSPASSSFVALSPESEEKTTAEGASKEGVEQALALTDSNEEGQSQTSADTLSPREETLSEQVQPALASPTKVDLPSTEPAASAGALKSQGKIESQVPGALSAAQISTTEAPTSGTPSSQRQLQQYTVEGSVRRNERATVTASESIVNIASK